VEEFEAETSGKVYLPEEKQQFDAENKCVQWLIG
jgi:hypothetical protein